MSYLATQLATETFPIMPPEREAPRRSHAHILPSSFVQGVDVISAIQDYDIKGLVIDLRQPFQLSGVSQTVSAFYKRVMGTTDEASTVGIGIEQLDEYAYENFAIESVPATGLINQLGLLGLVITSIDGSHSRISTLQERFEFRNRDDVRHFLRENTFLIDLLIESEEKVKVEFGDSTRFSLQVVKDPDFDDNDELFLIVKTTLPALQATEALERLDNNWWIEASSAARCKLNIDYELT